MMKDYFDVVMKIIKTTKLDRSHLIKGLRGELINEMEQKLHWDGVPKEDIKIVRLKIDNIKSIAIRLEDDNFIYIISTSNIITRKESNVSSN